MKNSVKSIINDAMLEINSIIEDGENVEDVKLLTNKKMYSVINDAVQPNYLRFAVIWEGGVPVLYIQMTKPLIHAYFENVLKKFDYSVDDILSDFYDWDVTDLQGLIKFRNNRRIEAVNQIKKLEAELREQRRYL